MTIKAGRFSAAVALISTLVILPVSIHAEDYAIGSDDVLKISVYREEELDREVRVGTNGCISLPLLGEIKVEGFTVSKLEEGLTEKYRKFIKKPQVTVFIKEYATISVTGQVTEPGSFPLKSEMGVLEAIGLAKGFTKIASQNDVKIMRTQNGEKVTVTVRVADISKKGDKTQDVALRRGDIVFVPESLF